MMLTCTDGSCVCSFRFTGILEEKQRSTSLELGGEHLELFESEICWFVGSQDIYFLSSSRSTRRG